MRTNRERAGRRSRTGSVCRAVFSIKGFDVLHHPASQRLADLRKAVAAIEAAPGLSYGRRLKPDAPAHRRRIRLGDGALGLDGMLGGGLRRGALHEIVAAHRQDEARPRASRWRWRSAASAAAAAGLDRRGLRRRRERRALPAGPRRRMGSIPTG